MTFFTSFMVWHYNFILFIHKCLACLQQPNSPAHFKFSNPFKSLNSTIYFIVLQSLMERRSYLALTRVLFRNVPLKESLFFFTFFTERTFVYISFKSRDKKKLSRVRVRVWTTGKCNILFLYFIECYIILYCITFYFYIFYRVLYNTL